MQSEDQEEVYVEEPQEQNESQGEEKAQNSAEYNWRELRSVAQTQKMEIESQKSEIETLKTRLEEINKPKEVDEWEGYDPDDYAKVEHVKKSTSEMKQLKKQLASMQQKLQITEAERKENEARSKFDDYDYVIDNFGIPMIKKNPALGQALKALPNWAEMAYEMAKATPEYKAAQSNVTAPKAEKVIKNTERPTSINAAPASVKKQVDVFSSLSPSEVWKKSQEFARRA